MVEDEPVEVWKDWVDLEGWLKRSENSKLPIFQTRPERAGACLARQSGEGTKRCVSSPEGIQRTTRGAKETYLCHGQNLKTVLACKGRVVEKKKKKTKRERKRLSAR